MEKKVSWKQVTTLVKTTDYRKSNGGLFIFFKIKATNF